MPYLIEKKKTSFFSSSTSLGASQRSADGSSFEVRLDSPIQVPPSAIDATIECVSANIWRTSPNISAAYKNNKLYFWHYEPISLSNTLVTLTIPDGLYSIAGLDAMVRRLLKVTDIPLSVPTTKFTGNEIDFEGDQPTQRVYITMKPNITFSSGIGPFTPDNIALTLGFTADPPFGNAGGEYGAQQVATLNKTNAYVIHTNLVHGGITVNNLHDNILTEIQLTSSPGDLLTYRPYIPYVIDGSHLKNGPVDLITFRLTNELGEPIDTNGEDWSFSIVIKYLIDANHVMSHGQVPSISMH